MVKKCKNPHLMRALFTYGGGHEIRTHGSLHFATFPRWCLKPLGQSSKGKYYYSESMGLCHAKKKETFRENKKADRWVRFGLLEENVLQLLESLTEDFQCIDGGLVGAHVDTGLFQDFDREIAGPGFQVIEIGRDRRLTLT